MLFRCLKLVGTLLMLMASILMLGAGFFVLGKIKRAALYPGLALLFIFVFVIFRGFSYLYGLPIFMGLLLLFYVCYWLDLVRAYGVHSVKKVSSIAVSTWCIAQLLLLAILAYNSSTLTGYRIYHIPSTSMMPALLPGDYVLVDLWHYPRNPVLKNEVVVFKHPYKDRDYIKRVSHIPGELFLGKTLAQKTFAMLGDNEDQSEDSRIFGAVNQTAFKGKATVIVFSLNKQGGLRLERMLKAILIF